MHSKCELNAQGTNEGKFDFIITRDTKEYNTKNYDGVPFCAIKIVGTRRENILTSSHLDQTLGKKGCALLVLGISTATAPDDFFHMQGMTQ